MSGCSLSGVQHAHSPHCSGGRGAGVSLLALTQPCWSLGAQFQHWWGARSCAEVLLHARLSPSSFVLPPLKPAFVVRLCQNKLPSPQGGERRNRILCFFTGQMMQPDERSHVHGCLHSAFRSTAQHRVQGLASLPCLPSAKPLCTCPLRELLMLPQPCSGSKIADGHITKPETLKCFLE